MAAGQNRGHGNRSLEGTGRVAEYKACRPGGEVTAAASMRIRGAWSGTPGSGDSSRSSPWSSPASRCSAGGCRRARCWSGCSTPVARGGRPCCRLRAGILVALLGVRALGRNLTPATDPVRDGTLVETGHLPPDPAPDLHRGDPRALGHRMGLPTVADRPAGAGAVVPLLRSQGGGRGSEARPSLSRISRVPASGSEAPAVAHAADQSSIPTRLHLPSRQAMQPPQIPGFRPRAVHRRHLRHGRGRSGMATATVTPTGATSARACRRPARSRARRRGWMRCTIGAGRPGVRAGAGHLGAAPGGGGALQPAVPPGQDRRSTPRRTSASAAAGGPRSPARWRRWARSTSATSSPTTPPTRSCSTSSSCSPPSRSCSRASGATSSRLDDLRREITGRGLSAVLLSNPSNPTGKVIRGRGARGLGGDRAGAAVRAAARRVLLALRLDAGMAADRWCPPRGTWRTSTGTRS